MLEKIKLPGNLTRTVGRGRLLAQKHSPEILLGLGLVGGVAAAIMAAKATLKVEELEKDQEAIRNHIERVHLQKDERYSEEDYQKDLVVSKVQHGLEYVKLYGPSVGLGIASVAAILGSHGIMQKRSASLMAAYGLLQEGFASYRNRVVEELGEDRDRDFRFGIHEEVIETETVNEKTGKVKVKKEKKRVQDPNAVSDYARFFDEFSPYFKDDPNSNSYFVRMQQNYANEQLISRGYLFLNEVYEMLGLPWTSAGQMVGWVLNGKNGGDGYVDFGLKDTLAAEFINGWESAVLLDFNVDGVIYDLI